MKQTQFRPKGTNTPPKIFKTGEVLDMPSAAKSQQDMIPDIPAAKSFLERHKATDLFEMLGLD